MPGEITSDYQLNLNFEPTDTNYEITDTGVKVTFTKVGEKPEDTLQQTVVIDAVNLSIDGFSFLPGAPSIYAPTIQDLATVGPRTSAPVTTNPWFAPSLLAGFFTIMMSLLDQERTSRYMESQSYISMAQAAISMAINSADLTKLLYDKQALEKQMEAFASFANAAVGVMQVTMMTMNVGKAEAKVQSDIDKFKANEIDKHPDMVKFATDNPTKMDPAEINAHLMKNSPSYAAAKQQLEKMELSKAESIRTEVYSMNQLTNAKAETLKSSISGVSASLSAWLKSEQGAIDALKQTNDGYRQAVQGYADNANKARNDEGDMTSRYNDFVQKYIEMLFRSHSISQRA